MMTAVSQAVFMSEPSTPPPLSQNTPPSKPPLQSVGNEAIDIGATIFLILGLILAGAFALLAIYIVIKAFPR
jgi:hypothetical protein